jgi:hemerythrin superfamily protein
MNAITVLKQDHGNVEALFRRFETAGDDLDEKRRVRDLLVEHLSQHAGIEETVFYPAVRAAALEAASDEAGVEGAAEAASTVLESLEEHHLVKLALHELEKFDPAHERFDAKMAVLIENVRHHVTEEEDELFPRVRELFTPARLEEVGDTLERARATAPKRPHPMAPDRPPANALVSIPMAVVDRIVTTGKDVVRGIVSGRAT